MNIQIHPRSVLGGAIVMAVWMGTAWFFVHKNNQDDGTRSIIKAMQSDESRLVTVTFADGSQILRVPPQGLGVPTVGTNKAAKK
jgi:hypothetical protein